MNRFQGLVLGCVACGFAAAYSSVGEIVLDNLGTPLPGYLGGFSYDEVGDDFTLAGSARIFEAAAVAYLASPAVGAAFNGDETLTLNLYNMDGAPTPGSFGFNTPGSVVFSQTVPISATDNGLALFSDLSGTAILPDFLGVGLVFGGIDLGAGEDRGPLLYDPPVAGTSLDDYWLRGYPNSGDPWALFTFGGNPPINLGVQIEARSTNVIPEPGTWISLSGLGLLVGTIVFRRMRRA